MAESWPAELVNANDDRQILADVTRWQARNRIDHYLHYLQDGPAEVPRRQVPEGPQNGQPADGRDRTDHGQQARTLADARPEWNVEIEKAINWPQWDKRSPEGKLRSD